MSSEFSGSVFGISGAYKKVAKGAVILKPCEHYIIERNTLFKHLLIQMHGKEDGGMTYEKIEV